MKVLLWHGWLLEGTGSNVYTARVAEALRKEGHDVLLMCQERDVERYGFIDAWGSVNGEGVSALRQLHRPARPGRGVLLRPDIGTLLPVFVIDEYEGFQVRSFVDLNPDELDAYLERNVIALREAASWFSPDVVVAGHVVPGGVIARRALGPGSYVIKVHGSDLEYAIRLQPRYRTLAEEALDDARAVTGATADVLSRAAELIPSVAGRARVVPPGVEVDLFRPKPRREVLLKTAALLRTDPDTTRGRPPTLDQRVRQALEARDAAALSDLARSYDQAVPDPGAAERLVSLAEHEGPIVGSFGKLIPQKGVELLLAALPHLPESVRALVVGFGLFREWLAAFVHCLDQADEDCLTWFASASGLTPEVANAASASSRGLASRVTFTGRLDHRYAPGALAAMDVLVVPSVLHEAFGMVAAEGAAAGALPLVVRHSGLAEVGAALEEAVRRPGLFTFDPGPGAVERIAIGVDRLLQLAPAERADLARGVSEYVAGEWTWERTAERLLAAAMPG